MNKIISFFLLVVFFTANSLFAQHTHDPSHSPRNIILMIGDGMGFAQLYKAYAFKKKNLNIVRCNYTGIANTNSASDLITDSGAAGTALATGHKTDNRHISMSPEGIELKTILEYAEQHGKATGLVATSRITHATPAAFIAHEPSRYNYEEIALDFLNCDIDVFIGGGWDHFYKRSDTLNLLDSLHANGYKVVLSMKYLDTITCGKVAGLVYKGHPPKISEGRHDFLSRASIKTIEILNQDPDGFFLMIESSQIDWGGHARKEKYILNEMLDFDDVVGQVLDFAEQDGETLVIITSDHETGGYAIVKGDLESGETKGRFSSWDHTPVFVPLFAYGPGAEDFTGLYENTEIFHKMMRAFGFALDK